MTEAQLDKRKVKLSLGLFIGGLVFLLVSFLYSSLMTKNYNNLVNNQTDTITGLQNKISVTEAANNRKMKGLNQTITGLNLVRKKIDDKKAEALLKYATTWNSGSEYRKKRSTIMKEYKLSDNDNFMKVFMPPLKQYGMTLKTDGNNEIDTDSLNLSYDKMKSYVTNIQGDKYSYFTVVTVNSHDKKGAVANGKIAASYTVNGHGKISNLNADTIGYTGQ